MAKYYTEYQSLKPKKGGVVLAVVIILMAAALALVIAFVVVPKIKAQNAANTDKVVDTGEEDDEEDEDITADTLAMPYELTLDETETQLSWKCADNASAVGYRIWLNGATRDVYTNPVTVNLQEGIESVILIKALGDNKNYLDSLWSEAFTVYKEDAEHIAYAAVTGSLESIIEANVKVTVGENNIAVEVIDIFAVDYKDYNAKIWYTYKVEDLRGLACSSVHMLSVSDVSDYKDKLAQIEATINSDVTTEFMLFSGTDYAEELLAREDLGGALYLQKCQNAVLTPVCSYTSEVSVADGKASAVFRGILRSERNGTIKYFSYYYTAVTDEVAGYSGINYLEALSDGETEFELYETVTASEVSGLAKEMLMMYQTRIKAYADTVDVIKDILEQKVKVKIADIDTDITADEIFAADYIDGSAVIWYAYTAGSQHGLARSAVGVSKIYSIIDFDNRVDEIEAEINEAEITTDFYPFIEDDYTEELFGRNNLSGALRTLKDAEFALTPVCSYTSEVTIAAGKASISFAGIVRAKRNGEIKYYSYCYKAEINVIPGFAFDDYLAALSYQSMPFAFTETETTSEISKLGSEMLLRLDKSADI